MHNSCKPQMLHRFKREERKKGERGRENGEKREIIIGRNKNILFYLNFAPVQKLDPPLYVNTGLHGNDI